MTLKLGSQTVTGRLNQLPDDRMDEHARYFTRQLRQMTRKPLFHVADHAEVGFRCFQGLGQLICPLDSGLPGLDRRAQLDLRAQVSQYQT